MVEDSDAAQARILLDELDAQIDIVAARIETVDALAECARRAHRLRPEAAALSAEPCEVHRRVDAIVFRFPEVMTRDATALD